MASVTPIKNNFNHGEISPLLYGRTDLSEYQGGCKYLLNWVPIVQGPIVARPGTQYISEVKDSTKITRLIPFQFSTTQAYILEFGASYIRFYRNKGVIESSPSVPYEIVSPYAESHLMDIQFVQSADVLYLVHPLYQPRKLSRTGHTSWTLSTITFLDGPYLPTNTTATTMTLSATTGSVTVTASTPTFASTDVGRVIRIKHSSTWGYARITVYTSTTVVTATVVNNFAATTASVNWRLGVWSDTTGWPGSVTFFGDRLYFGGSTSKPQRIDGSVTGDYENFQPSATDGTLADSDAVSFTLNANDVDAIQWMADNRRGLVVGTASSEWVLRSNSLGEAITYKNIFAERSSTSGSKKIQAIRTNETNLFIEDGGEKVRELSYAYEDDGYLAIDISKKAEHLFYGGVVAWAHQKKAQPVIWMVKADGTMIGLSYEPEQKVLGFHRHEMGGNGLVKSVATIPSPTGEQYEVWLITERTINGSVQKYVEVMDDLYTSTIAPEDYAMLDCYLTYDGVSTSTVTGLDHLEGETVTLVVDGSAHPDKVVTSGSVTLDFPGEKIHVGYNYYSDFQHLRSEGGTVAGTAQGLKKNIHKVTVRYHEAKGLQVGSSVDNLYTVSFRDFGDLMGNPVPLYTGDKEHQIDAGYNEDGYIYIRRNQPFPATIIAIMPKLRTSEL